jgi:hypothetical protein
MFRHIGVRTAGILLGAVALFAIVGFAASFALAPEKVVNAEGEVLVVSCDNEMLVWKLDRWQDPVEGAPGDGGFYAWLIQLRTVNEACIGNNFNIVVTGEDGKAIATSGWFVYSGSPANVNWTLPTPIPVKDIHDIHVAISSNPQ